jgi:restriction system protein
MSNLSALTKNFYIQYIRKIFPISREGVFVTTSYFAPQAKAYAERSPKRLILIDREELTRLMVRYGVGVRAFRTVELKKIDLDYFNVDE